jgi:hypothetical protein
MPPSKEELMRTLLICTIAIAVALNLLAFEAWSRQETAEPDGEFSPLAPPLVREGDFAIKLAEVFGFGEIIDEEGARQLLAEIGLSPRDGWVVDYPVTPVILAELREAVIASSETGRLSMTVAEALEAFDFLALNVGLSVDVTPEREPLAEVPEEALYAESPEINYYYATEGPPIMTYNPPPSYYSSYYDWVPYSFYFSRGYYPGFFILRDFHRASKLDRHFDRKHQHKKFGFHNRSRQKFISNRHLNPRAERSGIIRPNISERSDMFSNGLRHKSKEGTIKRDGSQTFPHANRGGENFSFRGAGKPGFPRPSNGLGRIDNWTHNRRFSGQEREFRGSRFNGRQELTGRSSAYKRYYPGEYTGSGGSHRRANDGSFRPFNSNAWNGGNSGSVRSSNSSNRGFYGSRGGTGSGRR